MLVVHGMTDHEILLTGKGALPFRFAPSPVPESTLAIPHMLHMIWIGGPIPNKYLKNVLDFRLHNPTWKVALWSDYPHYFEDPRPCPFWFRDTHDAITKMRNLDMFDAETNVAAKVDLLRYELIYQEGGVYLDADTLSLAPGSLDRMTQAFLTVSGEPWYNTGNAQFGFAKGSEFLAYVIANARDPRVRAETCITRRTGPTFLTTCALSFGDMRIVHPNGRYLLERVHHLAEKNW